MMMRRRGGLVRGVARTAVVAGTASAVSGRVHHRQQERWSAQEEQQYAQQEAAYAQQQAAAAPAGGDDMAELQKLAELHNQGILTDEEFAAKKAQILGI
jgi:hypothetical protein